MRTLRFHAGGKRHRKPLGAVSHDEAQRRLAYLLADVAILATRSSRGSARWRGVLAAPAGR